VVIAEIIRLAERPGGAVHISGPAADFSFREQGIGSDPLDLRHFTIVLDALVNEHQRTERLAVMRVGGRDIFGRIRNGPDLMFGKGPLGPAVRTCRVTIPAPHGIIAVIRTGVAAVGIGDPEMVGGAEIPINIVPAGVDKHAFVIHRWMPFMRFVITDGINVASIRLHGVEVISGTIPTAPEKAQTAVSPRNPGTSAGHESDSAIRQQTRVEVVPHAIGQLNQVGAVNIDSKDMV